MCNFDLVKQVYEHVTENNFCNMNLANESQLYTYFTKIQNSFYLRVVGEKVSYMSFKKISQSLSASSATGQFKYCITTIDNRNDLYPKYYSESFNTVGRLQNGGLTYIQRLPIGNINLLIINH